MLNIDALRLTFEECSKARRRRHDPHAFYGNEQDIAKAQLAKAAYGFYDWLTSEGAYTKAMQLLKALEQANIKRPTADHAPEAQSPRAD